MVYLGSVSWRMAGIPHRRRLLHARCAEGNFAADAVDGLALWHGTLAVATAATQILAAAALGTVVATAIAAAIAAAIAGALEACTATSAGGCATFPLLRHTRPALTCTVVAVEVGVGVGSFAIAVAVVIAVAMAVVVDVVIGG